MIGGTLFTQSSDSCLIDGTLFYAEFGFLHDWRYTFYAEFGFLPDWWYTFLRRVRILA